MNAEARRLIFDEKHAISGLSSNENTHAGVILHRGLQALADCLLYSNITASALLCEGLFTLP